MTDITEFIDRIKSKNAGPFEITITIQFKNRSCYERVIDSGALDEGPIKQLYSLQDDDLLGIYELERLNTVKIAMKRPLPAADFYDTDLMGTQQHAPILTVEIESNTK